MGKHQNVFKAITGFVLVFIIYLFAIYVFDISVAASTIQKNGAASSERAIEGYEEITDRFIKPIFGEKNISLCDYAYNLDDSDDYIYVEFENGGYALYAKATMEILEYSMYGRSPYFNSNDIKYYGGPSKYFYKNGNDFIDAVSGEKTQVLKSEQVNIANRIRKKVMNQDVEKYVINIHHKNGGYIFRKNVFTDKALDPELDENNLIAASSESGHLIPNFEYFISNPTIGENMEGEVYGNGNSGTCGPVAAQLLLGFNNFYNDRRIIENRFLNGFDDVSNRTINAELNPNFCANPMLMNSNTTGTRSEGEGANSFYVEMISRIMKPNTSGSTNKEVKEGISNYLNEHLSSNGFTINYEEKGWWFGYSPIDSSIIKSEINAGRPIIISMDRHLGGINHFVVGYGYQDYVYPDGNGTYGGYVVHFGWQGTESTCVWVNSSWCDGYVSLKINHEHDYYARGLISYSNKMEYRCSTCGHRTDAAINIFSNDRYKEIGVTLNSGDYKDYYLTFETGGNKLIQTFGDEDTVLYLYDLEYNLLAESDDEGYSRNSFFNYSAIERKAYILRVKFYSRYVSGNLKIGITPSSVAYSRYEDVWKYEGSDIVFFNFETSINATTIMSFTPTISGSYTLQTGYLGDSIVDSYLYVVFPHDTCDCLYNDDGAGSLQARISIDLLAGQTCFIVVSTYNINTMSGNLSLCIAMDD